MNVVIADVDSASLETARQTLVDQGASVLAVPTDVSDPAAVDRLADAAYQRFRSVRLLVNNAGIESLGPIWQMTTDHWHRVQNVNAGGAFHGIGSFVPRMSADPNRGSSCTLPRWRRSAAARSTPPFTPPSTRSWR